MPSKAPRRPHSAGFTRKRAAKAGRRRSQSAGVLRLELLDDSTSLNSVYNPIASGNAVRLVRFCAPAARARPPRKNIRRQRKALVKSLKHKVQFLEKKKIEERRWKKDVEEMVEQIHEAQQTLIRLNKESRTSAKNTKILRGIIRDREKEAKTILDKVVSATNDNILSRVRSEKAIVGELQGENAKLRRQLEGRKTELRLQKNAFSMAKWKRMKKTLEGWYQKCRDLQLMLKGKNRGVNLQKFHKLDIAKENLNGIQYRNEELNIQMDNLARKFQKVARTHPSVVRELTAISHDLQRIHCLVTAKFGREKGTSVTSNLEMLKEKLFEQFSYETPESKSEEKEAPVEKKEPPSRGLPLVTSPMHIAAQVPPAERDGDGYSSFASDAGTALADYTSLAELSTPRSAP